MTIDTSELVALGTFKGVPIFAHRDPNVWQPGTENRWERWKHAFWRCLGAVTIDDRIGPDGK